MPLREPKIDRDGFTNLLRGMDSGRVPTLLDPNQCAMALNVTMRSGYAQSRPGFKRPRLRYDTTEMRDWVNSHIFQGAYFYTPREGAPYWVASIGGRLFRGVIGQAVDVTEITPYRTTQLTASFVTPPIGSNSTVSVSDGSKIIPGFTARIGDGRFTIVSVNANAVVIQNVDTTPGVLVNTGELLYYLDPNSPDRPQAWMEQAEEFLVIQNGLDAPIIFNGSMTRRSNTHGSPREVPTGTVMAYGIGRLWVAITDHDFVAGDIDTRPTGVTSPITFTENTFINGGGAFKVQGNVGVIRAMKFISSLNTSLGQGPMMVLTDNAIFSVDAPVTREAWQNVTNPIQTVSLINNGATSHSSVVLVNGDMFYRSPTGINSYIMAVREFGTWGNVPVSTEMDRVLPQDDLNLLRYASAILFDNRLICTAGPRPLQNNGWYHSGMVVLDFHLISAMGHKSPPAWDGLWTGINPYQLLISRHGSVDRAFAFVRGVEGLEFWEITKDSSFDRDGLRIESYLETAAFKGRSEFTLKKLSALELWVDKLEGNVDFTIHYKTDGYPCWFPWKERPLCVVCRECQDDDTCVPLTTFNAGHKTRFGFGRPQLTCNTADGKPSDVGYEAEIRIAWTGKARIKKALIKFADTDELPSHVD